MSRFVMLSEPRTGSTFLTSLLRQTNRIYCIRELLNEKDGRREDPLGFVESKIQRHSHPVVGFKVFCQQMRFHGFTMSEMVRRLNIKWIIVLWRQSTLETLASLKIANNSGIWCTSEQPTEVATTEISEEEVKTYIRETEDNWKSATTGWPPDVVPIFVKYEDLVENQERELNKILLRMSIDPSGCHVETWIHRQNPNPLHLKVSTMQLLGDYESSWIDVPAIVNKSILDEIGIPDDVIPFLPDREPAIPATGWRYRVAEPFLSAATRENVLDAVDSRSVSSAGIWVRNLSHKLKEIFKVPVAQPCCNGYAALVLALKAAGIGPGDQVIIPSFTMIAVANAVDSVQADVVPVDNAVGDYNPGVCNISEAATQRTKAVILSHTYGVPTRDIEQIAKLCSDRGWCLIEDISECAGIINVGLDGKRRLLGTFGDFACASMYANKILHAGDGGFVLAKDPRQAYVLGSLVNHGFTGSFHFLHVVRAPNFKICGMAAAIACGCLDSIGEIMSHRSTLSAEYRTHLASTPLRFMPKCGPDDTPWVFGVECSSKTERQQLREYLAEKGIETRNYFFPIHCQPAYADLKVVLSAFEQSNYLSQCGFYLPSFTGLKVIDIRWICSVVASFYSKSSAIIEACPAGQEPSLSVRIDSQTLSLEMKEFDREGHPVRQSENYWFWHNTVGLHERFKRHMTVERWDEGQLLLNSISGCLKDSEKRGLPHLDTKLRNYQQYIISQASLEQEVSEQWTNENITEHKYEECLKIPTTTEPQVFRFLCWLIRTRKVKTILEIGSWLGASTLYMATAAATNGCDACVISVDNFIWANWMDRFCSGSELKVGDSFLSLFLHYTKPMADVIRPIQWQIGSESIPVEQFEDRIFNLVFLDFAKVAEDIEELVLLWDAIKPHLEPKETVVVINQLNVDIAPFIACRTDLVPIAKPSQTVVKAFLYVGDAHAIIDRPIPASMNVAAMTLKRQLNFLQEPSWNHHYKNSFREAIAYLREKMHSPSADVDFISAVGEFMCDSMIEINRPWIGIIHSVPCDDQFYPPDLERLCGRRYNNVMALCRGLFTLTSLQACYLRQHLSTKNPIPICQIMLPIAAPSKTFARDVLGSTANGGLNVLFIGSFARDCQFFYDAIIPSGMKKVLLAGDSASMEQAARAPNDVLVLERLDDNDYDDLLCHAVVFLSLKFDGAANTVVVECIARNVPIIAPKLESCIEYLGDDYPLLYDVGHFDLREILTKDNLLAASEYLARKDKTQFTKEAFCKSIEASSVLHSLPPSDSEPTQELTRRFDVTVSIASYKRTHNLQNILHALLMEQNFTGAIEVIVWNNSEARTAVVNQICQPFIRKNSNRRSLQLISSTQNYYCMIRSCMTHLMKSNLLLICDDDVIPRPTFIQFFVDAHRQHPNDIIGVRGHRFLPHVFSHHHSQEWNDRRKMRFVDDDEIEQFIHFIHADTCIIPRKALREFCSIALPDDGFALVDDYWMCFVLNKYFNRKLRKLQHKACLHFERTADADKEGLALYTRPEVRDARRRLYIYHMTHGWPRWSDSTTVVCSAKVTEAKTRLWNSSAMFAGFNVSVYLTKQDAVDLRKLGATVVRIGAVGTKEAEIELSGFICQPEVQLQELKSAVDMLEDTGIRVIITLHRELASQEVWSYIAAEFAENENVIGYDLVNEPFTNDELELHWTEVSAACSDRVDHYIDTMVSYIQSIRRVDKNTPIIVEPTFWGSAHALSAISPYISTLKSVEANIIISVHFYEPPNLVMRHSNPGRFFFPGEIPIFKTGNSEALLWDEEMIARRIDDIRKWQTENDVKVFIGEFGITRETRGAADYLTAVGLSCFKNGLSCILYSYREETWDAMNYELGPVKPAVITRSRIAWSDNILVKTIQNVFAMYARDD